MRDESEQQKNLEMEIKKQAQKFLEDINSKLPESMELEYEGYYKRGFFVSKKRYAVLENDEIIAKGLELVRRDWAPLVRDTQESVLKAILEEGDSTKAVEIIKSTFRRIRKREVDNKELVIHTQITKALDNYKQIGPHVVAAQKMKEKGLKITKGTIIQYIIIKGKGSISQRSEPYEADKEYTYDIDYYIDNQIIPAIERIMYAFGYSAKDLKDLSYGEVQKSLDDFF